MASDRGRTRRDGVAARLLAVGVFALVLSACAGGTAPGPSPTASSGSPSRSPSTTPPVAATLTHHEPACTSGQLAPALDPQHTGGAGGTEYVVILFRNTSNQACWLGGYPDLTGVTAAGTATRLVFPTRSDDPAMVVSAPAGPPGVLRPGGLGAVSLTLSDHDCPTPVPAYRTLDISVGPGAARTIPFPPELEITTCLGSEAEMGPVPADASPAPASLPAPVDAPCRMSQLSVVLGTAGAAGGTAYQQVDFRNRGTVACVLDGYPSLTFLDRSGNAVGRPATQTDVMGTPVVAVPLAPGGTGHASMGVATARNSPTSSCRPTDTVQIRIAVPGDPSGRTLASSQVVCSRGPSSTLVTPFAPGVPGTAVG
jgi:hypothetical protein